MEVKGYLPLQQKRVDKVNEFKQDEERLLRKLDEMRNDPEGQYDQRWVSVAYTGFQEAFMALNRSVFQPQRVDLPEDKE